MEEKITKDISPNDTIVYRNENRKYHNINDKPAIIWKNNSKAWYKNGKRHRTKGPAAIFPHKDPIWYYEGLHITSKVKQLMEEGKISPDWENWSEEDEFLFVLLVS